MWIKGEKRAVAAIIGSYPANLPSYPRLGISRACANDRFRFALVQPNSAVNGSTSGFAKAEGSRGADFGLKTVVRVVVFVPGVGVWFGVVVFAGGEQRAGGVFS